VRSGRSRLLAGARIIPEELSLAREFTSTAKSIQESIVRSRQAPGDAALLAPKIVAELMLVNIQAHWRRNVITASCCAGPLFEGKEELASII